MMNKLALMLVTATLGSQAAGCIIYDERDGYYDDPPVYEDVATISTRWALRNMIDGATTACPTGFDTVQLIAQPIDADGVPTAEPSVDLFDCEARAGTATDLVPDVYQVWIEVRSRDLIRLYAQSLSQVLDLRAADQSFDVDILNDGGYFQLSWDLIGATTNRPISCGAAGAVDKIHAISTNVADAKFVYEDLRPCEDHIAVTEGLLQGSYTITIDAVAGNASVGNLAVDRTIAGQNQVTDLGHLLIPVNGQ